MMDFPASFEIDVCSNDRRVWLDNRLKELADREAANRLGLRWVPNLGGCPPT